MHLPRKAGHQLSIPALPRRPTGPVTGSKTAWPAGQPPLSSSSLIQAHNPVASICLETAATDSSRAARSSSVSSNSRIRSTPLLPRTTGTPRK